MRVDKWIWAVRMVKTRTLAGDLCKKGNVLINDIKAKPAKEIKIGDTIQVTQKQIIKKYKVTGLIPKRVSAELAAKNYQDLSPITEKTTKNSPDYYQPNAPKRAKGEGRPTKKDYRQIINIRENW